MKFLMAIVSILVSGCATPNFIASRTGGIQVHPARFLGPVADGVSEGARLQGSSPSVITTCTTNGVGQLATTNCLSNGR